MGSTYGLPKSRHPQRIRKKLLERPRKVGYYLRHLTYLQERKGPEVPREWGITG